MLAPISAPIFRRPEVKFVNRLLWMRNKAICFFTVFVANAAVAQTPLSAIDWLDDRGLSVPGTVEPLRPIIQEPPVSVTALPPTIDEAPLGAPSIAAVGLLPPSVTGLPLSLWRASAAPQLERLFDRLDVASSPPLTSLLYTLLLAEAESPGATRTGPGFLLARAEKLLSLGAVDPASALMDRAGPLDPVLFPTWFEIALLTDDVPRACAALHRAPYLMNDLAARIFCLARDNDWTTAVTLLQTGEALGAVDHRLGGLLTRFLDPEMAEALPDLPPPSSPDALDFRLYEAVGERLSTNGLPRRFAVTDLGGDSGWKAQVSAAERLASGGAISANRLLGIYTNRMPAASGGVWDRVEAVQRLDTAMATGDPGAIASALERIWPLMLERGLIHTVADLYGDRLIGLPLSGRAAQISARLSLLSPQYEDAAAALPVTLPDRRLLTSIATGTRLDRMPNDMMRRAIARGFGPVALPERLRPLVDADRLGEAILRAMLLFETGAQGNPNDLTVALMALRSLGLEDTARRAALHLLLVELPA